MIAIEGVRKLAERASDYRFPKAVRMLSTAEFQLAFTSGIFAADQALVCNAGRNQLGKARLGLSVSRRVGNAVVRNKWKRAIREAFRTQQSRLPQGCDLVFRPKAGAEYDSAAIRRSVFELSQRVGRKLNKAQSDRGEGDRSKGDRSKGDRSETAAGKGASQRKSFGRGRGKARPKSDSQDPKREP